MGYNHVSDSNMLCNGNFRPTSKRSCILYMSILLPIIDYYSCTHAPLIIIAQLPKQNRNNIRNAVSVVVPVDRQISHDIFKVNLTVLVNKLHKPV